MSNPNEHLLNGRHDAALTRIAELEAENARLTIELGELKKVQQLDRECLIAHIMDDFPKSEEEFLRLAREGPSLRQFLDELVPEGDEEPRK